MSALPQGRRIIDDVERLDPFVAPVNRRKTVKQPVDRLPDSMYRASAYSTRRKVHRR
jgi:hypothetical protein